MSVENPVKSGPGETPEKTAHSPEPGTSAPGKKPKDKVDPESAEVDFVRWCEAFDIDIDPDHMDDDDRTGFDKQKRRIIDAMRAGFLVINEADLPVYTPQYIEGIDPITFREPKGASLMAMDGKKKNYDVTKLFAVMANMTKLSTNQYAKMGKRDLYVCMAVASFFLD